jgi:hypothetical protein
VIHIYSCAYWFIKINFQTEEQLSDFVSSFNVDPDGVTPVQKWIISGYFINTIFSTGVRESSALGSTTQHLS